MSVRPTWPGGAAGHGRTPTVLLTQLLTNIGELGWSTTCCGFCPHFHPASPAPKSWSGHSPALLLLLPLAPLLLSVALLTPHCRTGRCALGECQLETADPALPGGHPPNCPALPADIYTALARGTQHSGRRMPGVTKPDRPAPHPANIVLSA